GGATLDRHAVHMVWGRGRTSGTARRLRSAWLGLALVLVAALSAAAAQAAPTRVADTLTLTPSSPVQAIGGDTCDVVGHLSSGAGGDGITFSFIGPGAPPNSQVLTNSSGDATYSLTGGQAGTIDVSATDGNGADAGPTSVTFSTPQQALTLTLTPSSPVQ